MSDIAELERDNKRLGILADGLIAQRTELERQLAEARAQIAAYDRATSKVIRVLFRHGIVYRDGADLSSIIDAALSQPAPAQERPQGRFTIAHDGFTGTVIGHYERLDGKRGVVMQQDGTKVVHVYGEIWLIPAPAQPYDVDAALRDIAKADVWPTIEWAEKMAAKEGDTDPTTGKPAPAQEDKP